MNFRIQGLPAAHFTHLFGLSDDELARHRAARRIADERPIYPCRISLTDALAGDEILLVNYEHHPVDTPYRALYAIYVRKGEQAYDAMNDVPAQLRTRLLSLRAFDEDAMMSGCLVTEGAQIENAIQRLFAKPNAAYIHAHYAAAGCYAARISRA
jgi:hypothetical protein